MFDREDYCTTGDSAVLTVFDTDLNTDPLSVQIINVHVISNSDLVGIDMILTEETIDSNYFTSTATGMDLTFDKINSLEPLGIIKIADGDLVAVSYMDASPAVTRTDVAHWWDTTAPCLVTPTPPPVSTLSGSNRGLFILILGFIILLSSGVMKISI